MAPIIPMPHLPLIEVLRTAQEAGMYLITNGIDVVISPIVPPGWRKIPYRIKEAA